MKQRIDIIGRLGRDPETRKTNSGKSVTNFSLAVTEKYNGNETTTWFNCIAWEKAGEVIAQYVKKGDMLNVEGKISVRTYDDKEGKKQSTWEVVVKEFTFIGSSSSTGLEHKDSTPTVAGSNPAPSANPFASSAPVQDEWHEDIPF